MTMGNKKNVPAIRFKGFTEVWNNELLGKLATFSKGCGYSKGDLVENGIPIILYGRLYTKYQTVISDIDTFAIQKKGSIISKGIEVVVPASGETAEDISRASAIVRPNVIIAGDLNIIYPNRELNSVFLALSISNGNAQKNLSKKAQGKSVVHLHNSDLNEIELNHPAVDEQKAIGNFFQNIDRLIHTSQTKLDKLKIIKKACLEKMFPRNGSNTPELRFKRFANKLKYVYLKDIGSWDKGCGLSKADLNKEGLYPCIHYGELFSYSEIIKNVMSFTNKKSDKTTSNNDILFPDSDVTPVGLGRCSAIEIPNIILGGGINVLRLYKDFKAPYISLNVNNNRKQIIEKVTGTTVRHIHSKDLSDIGFFASDNLTEQQKIGDYFAELDNLIAKTEQQINKLKNIKKACLDKMFVNRKD